MLHEIMGAQLGLLLAVQKASMHEMVALCRRRRWKKNVKQGLNNKPGQRVLENTFTCEHCGRPVPTVAPGARQRSHCPHCLWSLHTATGSATARDDCHGQMEPVAVATQSSGAWSLVHHCRQCSVTQVHAIAVDDNGAALLTIASRSKRPMALAMSGKSIGHQPDETQ